VFDDGGDAVGEAELEAVVEGLLVGGAGGRGEGREGEESEGEATKNGGHECGGEVRMRQDGSIFVPS
jgi:hypothetical protein